MRELAYAYVYRHECKRDKHVPIQYMHISTCAGEPTSADAKWMISPTTHTNTDTAMKTSTLQMSMAHAMKII